MHARGNEIVAKAKEYLGTRWKHQGRTPGVALDCAGVFICIANDLGITDFDTARYSRRPNRQEFRNAMLEMGCTPVGSPEQGDILRIAAPRWPVHVGIYEKDEQGAEWVIHGYAPAKKVIRERITPERWLSVREVMRYPE